MTRERSVLHRTGTGASPVAPTLERSVAPRRSDGRRLRQACATLLGVLASATLAFQSVACQSSTAVEGKPEPARPVAAPLAPGAPPVTASSSSGASPGGQVALARHDGDEPSSSGVGNGVVKGDGATPNGARPSPATSTIPAAEPVADGAPAQGKVVSEEPFSVWLQASKPVSAGSAGEIEAVLECKAPYHCNQEYPHKFKLGAAPSNLSYPQETVKGMQVTPERGVLRIPVQAKSSGAATVSGTLSFSVCTEERCLVEKRELSLALNVK